jgi:hypothetical protein
VAAFLLFGADRCRDREAKATPPLWQYFLPFQKKADELICAPKGIGPSATSHFSCKTATSWVPKSGHGCRSWTPRSCRRSPSVARARGAGHAPVVAVLVRARQMVDPLMAHLPVQVNSWKDQMVRQALAPLHGLAEETGAAVLVVAHLNKGQGTDPLHRLGGSIGIPAAARSVLLLGRSRVPRRAGARFSLTRGV